MGNAWRLSRHSESCHAAMRGAWLHGTSGACRCHSSASTALDGFWVWRGSRALCDQMCYPIYTQAQLLTLVHVEGLRDGEEILTMAPHGRRSTARGPAAALSTAAIHPLL